VDISGPAGPGACCGDGLQSREFIRFQRLEIRLHRCRNISALALPAEGAERVGVREQAREAYIVHHGEVLLRAAEHEVDGFAQ